MHGPKTNKEIKNGKGTGYKAPTCLSSGQPQFECPPQGQSPEHRTKNSPCTGSGPKNKATKLKPESSANWCVHYLWEAQA